MVEVYPAASLRQWSLPYRGYKGRRNAAVLADLLDALLGGSTMAWNQRFRQPVPAV